MSLTAANDPTLLGSNAADSGFLRCVHHYTRDPNFHPMALTVKGPVARAGKDTCLQCVGKSSDNAGKINLMAQVNDSPKPSVWHRLFQNKLVACWATLLLLAGCTIAAPTPVEEAARTTESGIPAEATTAKVERVVDGDTIVVIQDGKEHRVRYLLIDTPERGEPLYNEATKLNQLLIGGQTVFLVKDVSETDRYDRLLRYVYTEDGLLVNAEIVRQGMARIAVIQPDTRLQKEIRAAESEARKGKLGIWN